MSEESRSMRRSGVTRMGRLYTLAHSKLLKKETTVVYQQGAGTKTLARIITTQKQTLESL